MTELRELRRAANLSQHELAVLMCVPVNTFRMWDSGLRPVPLDVVQRAKLAVTLAAIGLTAALAGCDGQHATGIMSVDPSPAPAVASASSVIAAAVDIAGEYTLTLLASPTCTAVVDGISQQPLPLPTAAQMRRYDAKVTQRSGQLEVVFTPAECSGGYYREPGICGPLPAPLNCQMRAFAAGGCASGVVSGRDMSFNVTPAPATPHCAGGDYWSEQFTATEVFEACGIWRASIDDPARITGTVDGTFGYLRAPAERYRGHFWESDLYCRATDHHFTLTKH